MRKTPTVQGRFRWKAIFIFGAVCTVLALGWYVLYRVQIASLYSRFLEQSVRAEESGNPERAARFLRQYLLVNPTDLREQARFGILSEQIAQGGDAVRQVLNRYEGVLEHVASRPDEGLDRALVEELHLRAAKLHALGNNLDKALEHLATLDKAGSQDPEFHVLMGRYKWQKKRLAKGNLDKAAQSRLLADAQSNLEKAKANAPSKLEAYWYLAQFLVNEGDKLRTQKPLTAFQVLNEMIEKNPQDGRAYLFRGEYRLSGYNTLALGTARALGQGAAPLGSGQFLAAAAVFGPFAALDLDGAGEDFESARQLVEDELASAKSVNEKHANDKQREKLMALHADVLLDLAVYEMARARENGLLQANSPHLAKARAHLQRVSQLYPKDARVLPRQTEMEYELARAQGKDETLALLQKAGNETTGRARVRWLWELTEFLIKSQMLVKAGDKIEEMKKLGVAPYQLDLLRAKILVSQGKWYKASDLLESARPLLVDTPAKVLEADRLLSTCYEQLGNAELQLAVCQRARRLNPRSLEPRAGLVAALTTLGRLDEAIEECQNLMHLPQAGSDAVLTYARLVITKNARTPLSQAHWEDVLTRLAAVRRADAKTATEADVLVAHIQSLQGRFDQAKQTLEAAKTASPEEQPPSVLAKPWLALAVLAGRAGDEPSTAQALQILQEAKKRLGDQADLRVAALRYVPKDKTKALTYLQPLAEDHARFEQADRGRLIAGLAAAYEEAGSPEKAEKLWLELAKLEPDQLGVRLALTDFYLRNRDAKSINSAIGIDKTLSEIQQIEGPNGPYWNFVQAQTLLIDAAQKDRNVLAKARKHLQVAKAKRPRWSRVPELLAVIAEQEGNSEQAIVRLREAVELGARGRTILTNLAMRLMERGRAEEAEEVMSKFNEEDGGDIQKFKAELSFSAHNPKRALELLGKAVADDSKNYKDHLWKGQVLAKAHELKKAEASLRRATELAGGAAEPWVALVQVQAAGGARESAKATMESMKSRVAPAQLPFALARCYLALNDRAMADKAYAAALAAQPNNLALAQSVIAFYLASESGAKAEPLLRMMIDPAKHWVTQDGQEIKGSDHVDWARRHLAQLLGPQPYPEKQREALSLIEENLKKNPYSLEDQIVKGKVLAYQPQKRGQALGILEKAFKSKVPTIEQMFTMANLYESEFDWPRARAYLVELLSTYANHPQYQEYLAAFVTKLVFHGNLDDAQVWLNKLQEVGPDSFRYTECLLRLEAKSGSLKNASGSLKNAADPIRFDGKKVLGPIKKYLENKSGKVPDGDELRLARAAGILSELGRQYPEMMASSAPEGEKLLRTVADKIGKKEGLLYVASFLANSHRLDPALDLCEQLLKDLPQTQVLPVAVVAVTLGTKPNQKQLERVEAWLKVGQQQDPKSLGWDGLFAALKERQEKYAEAEKLYKKMLVNNSDDPVALNNLAFLLALQGKAKEAFPMIQKLDALAAFNAEILDTRAVVLIKLGKAKEAEKDLSEALRQHKTGYRLFHLAQIYQSINNDDKTRSYFGQAWDLGLRSDMVHALERTSFEDIYRLWVQAK